MMDYKMKIEQMRNRESGTSFYAKREMSWPGLVFFQNNEAEEKVVHPITGEMKDS